MTMQVTKGEFDRRVKLLEQKVQQSANKLMNDYKEFVERINSITSDNADFNRYAAIVDRINSCFDTNGQFDGSHIAPLSIETAALSVGQRSQALNIDGLKFEVKDYKSSDSAYQYGILNITDETGLSTGNGTLTHYTLFNKLDENNNVVGVVADFIIPRKVININDTATSGNKNDLWYIYVELPCNKQDKIYLYDDSTTESKTGNIFISQDQIKVDDLYASDHKFLCVLLGTISKVFSKTIGTGNSAVTTYYRIVDLNYGLTTINGRLITTGRIEGSNSDSAYFDLDAGEIGGKINFSASQSSLNNYVSKNNTEILYKIGSTSTPPTTNMPYLNQQSINFNGWSETKPSTTSSNPYLYYCTISYTQTGTIISNFICSPAMLWVDGEWIYKTRTAYYLINWTNTNGTRPIPQSKPTSMPSSNLTYGNWTFNIENATGIFYIYTSEVTTKSKDGSNESFVSSEDFKYDEAASTSAYALSQTTTIDGGLILSSKILCGGSSNESIAGMMGTNSEYTFFSGDINPSSAPFYVKNDGSVYCSNLEVNNETFKIKNEQFLNNTIYNITNSYNNYVDTTTSGAGSQVSVILKKVNQNYNYYIKYECNTNGSISTHYNYLSSSFRDVLSFSGVSTVDVTIKRIIIFNKNLNNGAFTIYNDGFVRFRCTEVYGHDDDGTLFYNGFSLITNTAGNYTCQYKNEGFSIKSKINQ